MAAFDKRNLKPKACGCCGELYAPNSGSAQFCSDMCRLRAKSRSAKNGCTEFYGSLDKDGYGYLTLNGRKFMRAHRLSYMLNRGSIPDGMEVCHTCDNPSCINPEHLFLGTALDNKLDCIAKSRQCRGVNVRTNILSEADVLEIRKDSRVAREVAESYGVTRYAIYDIRSGKNWKWLSSGNAR